MKKLRKRGIIAAIAALSAVVLTSCPNVTNPQGGSSASIFAVDSKNGNVYEIDESSLSAGSTPLVSIGQNASGEIVFSGDTGFVAVGSSGNTAPGLYYFDASSSSPSAKRIGNGISAQYTCIASTTRGYVTSADFYGAYSNAVYPFDPSSPSSGLGTAVTGFPSGFYPQDIVVASGHVYVADNGNAKVFRLDSAGTAVEAGFATSAAGTTGLLAGNYDYDHDGDADAGVFVANTGGYDASWNSLPGSIDFIPASAADGTAATVVVSKLSVGRLAAFDEDTLVATNYGSTNIVDLSGSTPGVTAVTDSGTPFGSYDVDIKDEYAYVPDGTNAVYRFAVGGTDVQKISVGKTGEYVSNVGIRP